MIDINKLAQLSRLDLTSASSAYRDTLAEQIGAMVALADKVRSANTENCAALFHPMELSQPLREDKAQSTENFRSALLQNASQHDGSAYLVPKIIE